MESRDSAPRVESTTPHPNAPRELTPQQRRERAERRRIEQRELDRVRRRVGAVAFLAIILHADLALPVAAAYIHQDGRTGDAIGLLVMSAIVGILSVIGNRVIIGRNYLTPWLLLGLLPPAAGVWLVFFSSFPQS